MWGVADFHGVSVHTSYLVPPDKVFVVGEKEFAVWPTENQKTREVDPSKIIVHPWRNLVTGEYRPPFFTTMTLGYKEMERDQRRRAK